MSFDFWKYEGAGNDFVLLRDADVTADDVRALCDRHRGIGADGLMVLSDAPGYDFRMTYYNSDGGRAAMCGNGARCIALFAHHLGIGGRTLRFIGSDGEHTARIISEKVVEVGMCDVEGVERSGEGWVLDTGVPHYVEFVEDIDAVDVAARGREIRFDARFAPEGVNVNFAAIDDGVLRVRTYERGVEGETLACGTGATAVAIAAYLRSGEASECAPADGAPAKNADNRIGGAVFVLADGGHEVVERVAKSEMVTIEVRVAGGDLRIGFTPSCDGFRNVTLTGPARRVFRGVTS